MLCKVLRQLHWLPVRQRVRFKLACIMYKSVSGQAPQYLVDDVSFGQLRNMLKSYLFRFYSATAHRDFLIIAP